MASKRQDIQMFWPSFQYEVCRSTASLLYVLQGMEAVRDTELLPYNQWTPAEQQYAACFPKLTYVGVPLCLSGPPFDPNDVLAREGEAEQLAFKGWVEDVYHRIWEGNYRETLREAFSSNGSIQPEMDALGDLRLIRNDLVHEHGVATQANTGKCAVLTWFEPGKPIVLGIRHVFDFLNQLGFMTRSPATKGDGAVVVWTVFRPMEASLLERPVPKLVSLRVSMDSQLDGSSHHILSVVFENGVFANRLVTHPDDGTSASQRTELYERAHIDTAGDLHLPDGRVVDREGLYRDAVDALLGRGARVQGGGVPGPPIRFRRSPKD